MEMMHWLQNYDFRVWKQWDSETRSEDEEKKEKVSKWDSLDEESGFDFLVWDLAAAGEIVFFVDIVVNERRWRLMQIYRRVCGI